MERYDDYYRSTPEFFGSAPDPVLADHADLIDAAARVLDIGCGQGRHSFFLARSGLTIHALDPSIEAVTTVEDTAEREGLRIRTIHGGFEAIDTGSTFGAILVFGLIPDLSRDKLLPLATTVKNLLEPGGLIFITAFGTWDPAFEGHRAEWTTEGRNSFRSPDGVVRTYLEPGELPGLFEGLSVVHSWEGLGPEHRHGSGPVERHGRAEAVLRKTGP